MSSNRTPLLAAIAAVLSLGLAAPAFADDWKHDRHDRHDRPYWQHGHHDNGRHWGHDHHRHPPKRHVYINEYYYTPAPVYYPPAVAYPVYPGRPQVVVTVPPFVVGF